jgi:nucleoside-diphosphate-sugar epimerase
MSTEAHESDVLVVGGAGYIGSVLTRRLLEGGRRVRVLDSLLYGNGESLAGVAEHEGFTFALGDVRSPDDVRAAVDGAGAVVLLAALVGDPVCKRNPELARMTNLVGARNVIEACADAGVSRFVFASTCSNYGLREDDTPATESDELHPLSLYAETKVEMERELLGRNGDPPFTATVLRVSTAFGLSPRMRFDLTVSEFTRELALGHALEVYDADTWRPYCHVNDIAAAIVTVLEADAEAVGGEVFNVGGDDSNHTKRDIVEAALAAVSAEGGGTGEVTWTEGGADARNYRVSFAKIQDRLGFYPAHTVAGSIERLVSMIRAGAYTEIDSRPLYFGNLHLETPALTGEGSGGGDAG